jgi:AraC-like DNA-binding protein
MTRSLALPNPAFDLETARSGTDPWGTLGIPEDPRLARLVQVVESECATLRYALYRGGARVPEHEHDVPLLVYGVGGPCVERQNSAMLVKRRLTFHPAGYRHSLEYMNTTHVLVIEIHARPQEPWPACSTPLFATLYDDVWGVMLGVATGESKCRFAERLAGLLGKARACAMNSGPARMSDVVNHLHQHWAEVPSASAVAKRFGVSTQYLCRAFRKYTGVSLQQYGVALKLDHARGLLWGSGVPISQIAAHTGFADQSHLTRALSQRSSQTPRALRRLGPCTTPGSDIVDWMVS